MSAGAERSPPLGIRHRADFAPARGRVESAPANEARARSKRSGPSVDEISRRCTAKRLARADCRTDSRAFRAVAAAAVPRETVGERVTGRLASCPRCRSIFSICCRCDRGHVYCGPTCSGLARRDSLRRARRRHRHSLEGRLDHRDHERARRKRRRQALRVGDHGSSAPVSCASLPASFPEASSHAVFSTRFPSPVTAPRHCAVCRRRLRCFTPPERRRFSGRAPACTGSA